MKYSLLAMLTATKQPSDLDDDLPALPPLDGDESDANEQEVGEAELDTGESEEVGLDATTGAEDFEDEIEDLGEERDVDGRDNEAAGDDALVDPAEEIDNEDEQSWTDEPADSPDQNFDDELDDDESDAVIDSGEEGFEEPSVQDIDDEAALPPLSQTTGDENAEDLDLSEDAQIDDEDLSDSREALDRQTALPPPWPSASRETTYFVGEQGQVSAIAIAKSGEIFAAGTKFFRVADMELRAIEVSNAELAYDVTSLAASARNPSTLLAGTRLDGAWALQFAQGASATARPINGWRNRNDEAGGRAPFFLYPDERCIWGLVVRGGLFRSEDDGETWRGPLVLSPVAAAAANPDGSFCALLASKKAPLEIGRSSEGGTSWDVTAGPSRAQDDAQIEYAIAAYQGTLAISAGTQGLFLRDSDRSSWQRLRAAGSVGPISIAREASGLALYAATFFEGGARAVVLRYDLDTLAANVVFDLPEEIASRGLRTPDEPEAGFRIHAIVARERGQETEVWVGTGVGLFRVDIDHHA